MFCRYTLDIDVEKDEYRIADLGIAIWKERFQR